MIIRLPHCYPVVAMFNNNHWMPNGTCHEKSNTRLFNATLCELGVWRPSTGWRLWVYFRGGYSCYFELFIDRRPIVR